MDAETLVQLPSGAGEPQFSPDSRWLAYTEAGTVWVRWVRPVEEPGEAREIGTGRAPRWRPDGGGLSVLRREDGSSRIWLHPLDAPDRAGPLLPEQMAVADYAWSPDGHTIAVLEQVEKA